MTEARAFLLGRIDYERASPSAFDPALSHAPIRGLLDALGRPESGLPIIHVTGTKGKGSTSALIAAALMATGRRVGLFTSPHLHDLAERFRIDAQPIAPGRLDALIDEVRPAVVDADARGDPSPTFFDITTAIGLLHFAQSRVDVAVIEVGLGGRLDSTNVVSPIVSVIASVSLDHTKILGDTLEAIAAEKAGIVKPGVPAVSGVIEPGPAAVIARVARDRSAPLFRRNAEFRAEYRPPEGPLEFPTKGSVRVVTWRRDWGEIPLPLFGRHQADNTACALATLDVLNDRGWDVRRDHVLDGWHDLAIPARIEVVPGRPMVVIDGAHNVASARALVETLSTHFPARRRALVFGTTRDKDLFGQLRALLPLFDVAVATRYLGNPRAVPAEVVGEAMSGLGIAPVVAPTPTEALDVARRAIGPDGLVVVTGSLFLAAEAREVLGLDRP